MPLNTADILYPLNSTTVDTAAGIDVRLLSEAQAGATDSSQSVQFTHTQDGAERTFDPANALVTVVANASAFQGEGWALRLAQDMTPVDDVNYNAALNSGTLAVNVRALLNASGGTNLGGVNTILFRASLWRYDTVANTGVLIASGSQSQTWDTSTVGAENNTRKNTAISINVANTVEFFANEVLFLQIGCQATTLVDATLGTTNYDITLDVDDASTNIDFALNQYISQLGFLFGTSAGSASVAGSGAPVLPTSGSSAGSATVSGTLIAFKLGTGSSVASATATGTGAAVKLSTGTANGSSTVVGAMIAFMLGTGTSAGSSTASGVGSAFKAAVGTASGIATVVGQLIAFKLGIGLAEGVATGSGSGGAVKLGTGSSSGVATATGATAIVNPTVGTVLVGSGGGGTTIIKKISNYLFDD